MAAKRHDTHDEKSHADGAGRTNYRVWRRRAGLNAIGVLKVLGHRNIVSLDIAEDKLAAAQKAGAAKTVNASGAAAAARIVAAAGGPVEAVIDLVNASKTPKRRS
jgi:Zn-dependent alcohol dehydrogenase